MKKKVIQMNSEREQESLRSAVKQDLEQVTVASNHLLWINTPFPAAQCCSRALHTAPQSPGEGDSLVSSRMGPKLLKAKVQDPVNTFESIAKIPLNMR